MNNLQSIVLVMLVLLVNVSDFDQLHTAVFLLFADAFIEGEMPELWAVV